MLSKKEAKDIQSLTHKKFRRESGLFIVEGPKIISEFLQSVPQRIQKIYALPEWISENEPLIQDVPVQIIAPEELQRISQLHTPHWVLAVVQQFPSKQPLNEKGISLYLDTVQDPGNFGTIIRVADWFGLQHVVCSPGCADVYNPKVVQSTMASIARVNVFYDEDLVWLEKQQVPVWAATLAGKPVHQTAKPEDCILLIGNESKGVRPEWLQRAAEHITIPRIGQAESLNAAVATGILLSHLTT